MKENHILNGQLKPGYNVQNQSFPKYLSADAGYGSEKKCQYLEDVEISGYVKYNTFDKEQRTYKSNQKKISKVDFHRDNLHYNEQGDYYMSYVGQRIEKIYERENTTKSGYNQTLSVYEAQNCQECSLRGLCHKSKYNRRIERNDHLERQKNIMRNRLKSNEGQNRRKKKNIRCGTCLRIYQIKPKFREIYT
ncbi:transposase [Ichthyobacterium seriolicida]